VLAGRLLFAFRTSSWMVASELGKPRSTRKLMCEERFLSEVVSEFAAGGAGIPE